MVNYKPRPRTAAAATEKRRVHAKRSRYRSLKRIASPLAALLGAVLLYVWLTTNVTGLTYAIEKAEQQRSQLQDDVQRLDDRIAHLQSRDRLAEIAAKLGMREPASYAVIELPQPGKPEPRTAGLAFLEWFRTP